MNNKICYHADCYRKRLKGSIWCKECKVWNDNIVGSCCPYCKKKKEPEKECCKKARRDFKEKVIKIIEEYEGYANETKGSGMGKVRTYLKYVKSKVEELKS